MYNLVQLIHTLSVHRCLDKTISLIRIYIIFMNIILKNNLWSFKRMCFFCDQTHGRTNKLPIKISFFSSSNIMV